MGRLRDEDLRAILGPDYTKIIEAEYNSAKPVTLAEIRKSREKEANRLSEMRFTMFDVLVVGMALDSASCLQKAGLDIQADFGVAAILFGIAGLIILTRKRRAVLAAPLPDGAAA
ncbi:MAG: hypothetical protein JWO64_2449 [Hyphomicrobiales bacterium]|nr:hypothetical protein [Hyphomicrobiales bacterium]